MNSLSHMRADSIASTMAAEKYLTFHVNNELYGIPILQAQEIIGMQKVVAVPKAPDAIRGVINLRGRIIPIVELRKKFNLEPVEDTDRTCIIIISVNKADSRQVFGLVVDEVSEVLEIPNELMQKADFAISGDSPNMIDKVARLDERVVMLLNIDEIIYREDMIDVSSNEADVEE